PQENRESRLRVADEILLRDARACPERVAVEENVATNDPTLCAGKEIIALPVVETLRVEIIRSRQRRADSDGSVISGQAPADPEQHPCLPVSVDIADRGAELRYDVDAEAIVTEAIVTEAIVANEWQPP